MPFTNMTGFVTGGQGDAATWIIAISILISTILSILAFLGVAQGLQLRVWKSQIEARLKILEGYVGDVREESKRLLRRLGVKDIEEVLSRTIDYFIVEPVTIEPTDITKRLERVLRTEEERIEQIVKNTLRDPPSEEDVERYAVFKNAVTLLGIANALNLLYKYLRHLLLLGVKTRNAMLVAQLWMLLPFYMRIAKAYRDAAGVISKGIPIGDAAGPLVAHRLVRELGGDNIVYTELSKDTVYAVTEYKGRSVYVVRARGPGSTVGRPGEAVEMLAEKLPQRLAAIITVDAALKFEGEETGRVAEGSGVAMGDPGPEKIRIERLAVRHGIPLHAVAIKMGFDEAIGSMKKSVLEGVEKALRNVKRIIVESSRPGEAVIVVGVGNTIGVGL